MKRWKTVAIVGVGLIGGSIGLALRQRKLAEAVVGIGRRQASLRIARRVGAVTNTTIDLDKGVAEAELVVVCTPVGRIVERRSRRRPSTAREGTLITDAGSTKQTIVAALDDGLPPRLPLPGQPSAGRQREDRRRASPRPTCSKAAWRSSRPRRTPGPKISICSKSSGKRSGSVVVQMTPEEHDRALAVTSHLPHVAAAALAATGAGEVLPPRRHGHARHDAHRRRRSRTVAADLHAQPRQRADRAGAVRREAGGPARRARATATQTKS